jgi:hypothetical protein
MGEKFMHNRNLNLLFPDILLVLVGLAAILIGLKERFSSSNRSLDVLILLILGVIALALSFIFDSKGIFAQHHPRSVPPQNLDDRLAKLTQALTEAGNVISSIESEIQSRQSLVQQLESQKVIAEQAIKLSKEQVDAVAALLSEQVAKQSREDSRRDKLRDVFFFALGVLVSFLLSYFQVFG